jgi:beta-xylosidase
VCIAGLVLTAFSANASSIEITTYNAGWTDNFDGPTLENRWTWVREDNSHWSLTDNPGFLRIIAQPGSLYGAIGNNNILLTGAPSGNYQITTRVTISPIENFQGAGIIVYQDDDNYIRLSRRFANTGTEINFRRESSGVLEANIGVSETSTTIYLRISKVGESFSGYYSTNGSDYTLVGQIGGTITSAQIGITSECGPSVLEMPSDYDFFQLEQNDYQVFLPLIMRY